MCEKERRWYFTFTGVRISEHSKHPDLLYFMWIFPLLSHSAGQESPGFPGLGPRLKHKTGPRSWLSLLSLIMFICNLEKMLSLNWREVWWSPSSTFDPGDVFPNIFPITGKHCLPFPLSWSDFWAQLISSEWYHLNTGSQQCLNRPSNDTHENPKEESLLLRRSKCNVSLT